MIRNIVFDMGNVLIDYQPMEYTRRFFPTLLKLLKFVRNSLAALNGHY